MAGFPLTQGLPAGQTLPRRTRAQTAVEQPSSCVQKEPGGLRPKRSLTLVFPAYLAKLAAWPQERTSVLYVYALGVSVPRVQKWALDPLELT